MGTVEITFSIQQHEALSKYCKKYRFEGSIELFPALKTYKI